MAIWLYDGDDRIEGAGVGIGVTSETGYNGTFVFAGGTFIFSVNAGIPGSESGELSIIAG
jgi:hypothetical protein